MGKLGKLALLARNLDAEFGVEKRFSLVNSAQSIAKPESDFEYYLGRSNFFVLSKAAVSSRMIAKPNDQFASILAAISPMKLICVPTIARVLQFADA